MPNSDGDRHGRAKIALGLSLLFAVGAFAYLALAGDPGGGAVLAVLVVVAGVWEYRRRKKDERRVERLEAEAEQQRQQNDR